MRTANPGQGSDSWGQNRQAQARGGGSRASSVGRAAGNPLGPCPRVRARDRKISIYSQCFEEIYETDMWIK